MQAGRYRCHCGDSLPSATNFSEFSTAEALECMLCFPKSVGEAPYCDRCADIEAADLGGAFAEARLRCSSTVMPSARGP